MPSTALMGMLAQASGANGVSMLDAVVTAVNDDGTVTLTVMGGTVDSVPCLRSYTPRAEGDVVLVVAQDKRWVVLGAIGDEANLGIPDDTTISWGLGAPYGTGWVRESGGNVWVRKGQVHVAYAVADPTPDPSVPSSRPVTINPSDRAAYRDGRIERGEPNPIQGAWPSWPHPYSGVWTYGTAIEAACTGQSVDSMKIRLTRAGRGSGGIYGGAQVRLYLHDATSPTGGTPTLYSGWNPGSLLPGQAKTFVLPSSWVTALASGSARGIGCKAGTGNDYLSYGACGALTVTFD